MNSAKGGKFDFSAGLLLLGPIERGTQSRLRQKEGEGLQAERRLGQEREETFPVSARKGKEEF